MAQKIEKPLNIILLIGDGMGLAQISAAAFMNGGLALELFKNIGLVKPRRPIIISQIVLRVLQRIALERKHTMGP